MRKDAIYLLPQCVEYHAEHMPDHEAYKFNNKSLIYKDLYIKACQLAGMLIDAGLKKGDRVGIWMNRALEIPIAVHGIMQAGGAFVPLDPYAPLERIQFLLKDCGIRHIITNPQQSKFLKLLMEQQNPLTHIFGVQGDFSIPSFSWDEIGQAPTNKLLPYQMLENDLAYIIYTSGSTGAPKGIMHTHYSGLSYAKLSVNLYDIQMTDRVASHAQLHFDMSTFAFLSSPFAGASTVILPEAHTKMPASLSQLMEKENISIWYSVPLALTQLLQRGVLESRSLESLRWILYGGEPFPTKPLRALMELWPQAQFSNVYGPAEINQCTYYNIPELPAEDEPIPLGQVWPNTEVLIINENNEIIKDDEVGELLVRSATRMRGYWNQAELTEKSFFRKTTTPGIEEIFYRTGDLVQRNEKGELMFMGRKDRQVKTRGYRVELNEVEVTLMKHENIEEAAVFSSKNLDGETQIEAIVILKQETNLDENMIKTFTQKYLPSYAIPHTITFAESFPRTSAGKIDYKKIQNQ